ncbi:hypothetical protein NP493_364g02058 [Ridgeia piscesae]|uniref:Secernin-2 n=1 Tax=Ridgeia piscesae TaxID=27915 RepID=A0AAD9NW16_RIDPI|nr:hypothetical protein NP493_364g02058 [Ridgeia piscesae]
MSIGQPESCDTFVVLPPATSDGCVIFAKNADRPKFEVQEVTYFPAADHDPASEKLQCTYIEIKQAAHTHAVILSKPAWIWGAEMGSNEHGVAIGNEAVWTKLSSPEDLEERLIGMDFLRLGLERGKTAREALDVIAGLLEEYGQGGTCSETSDFYYHGSFLIADPTEAWVLETAGKLWAAERVTSGFRNISNFLTIGTKIDAMSANLKEHAQSNGYWKPEDGEFDFAKAYSGAIPSGAGFSAAASPERRYEGGQKLLKQLTEGNNFDVTSMFQILRDVDSGICRVNHATSATVASQVSALYPASANCPSCHWLTATPNPTCSVFKPFVFCPGLVPSPLTVAPSFGADDPAKVKPRFQRKVDRRHELYKAHEVLQPLSETNVERPLMVTLSDLETQCVADVAGFLREFQPSKMDELQELFKDIVETELKLCKTA